MLGKGVIGVARNPSNGEDRNRLNRPNRPSADSKTKSVNRQNAAADRIGPRYLPAHEKIRIALHSLLLRRALPQRDCASKPPPARACCVPAPGTVFNLGNLTPPVFGGWQAQLIAFFFVSMLDLRARLAIFLEVLIRDRTTALASVE